MSWLPTSHDTNTAVIATPAQQEQPIPGRNGTSTAHSKTQQNTRHHVPLNLMFSPLLMYSVPSSTSPMPANLLTGCNGTSGLQYGSV